MSRLPLLTLLCLLMSPSCWALGCFQCSDISGVSSAVNHPVLQAVLPNLPRCAEFDSEESRFKMETCLPPYDKTCSKATVDGQVVRGCFDHTLEEGCATSQDLTEICVCSGDYCNGAGVAAPAVLLLILPAALMAGLYSA